MIIDPNNPIPRLSVEDILRNHAQGLTHFKTHIENLIRKVNEHDARIQELKKIVEENHDQNSRSHDDLVSALNRISETKK